MKEDFDFTACNFAPVMDYPDDPDRLFVLDLSRGYDPVSIKRKTKWGIGRYNEKRPDMYTAPQYENRRNIHMGIDIWADAGDPVFSFYDGVVVYKQDNKSKGDYGPTIVTKHVLNGIELFALYGHLSRSSLSLIPEGERVKKKQKIGYLGDKSVNGGWEPHLHFQLSFEDPGEADMPGVVARDEHKRALKIYPDPRLVLGNLY